MKRKSTRYDERSAPIPKFGTGIAENVHREKNSASARIVCETRNAGNPTMKARDGTTIPKIAATNPKSIANGTKGRTNTFATRENVGSV